MHLNQFRHSRSHLGGNLYQKYRDLRLKDLEDDGKDWIPELSTEACNF